MFLDGRFHALQTCFDDAARHGEIEADKALGIAYKEAVASLQKNSRLIGKEAGQIVHVRKAVSKIDPCEIGGLWDTESCLGEIILQVFVDKAEVLVQIFFQFLQPLTAVFIRPAMLKVLLADIQVISFL